MSKRCELQKQYHKEYGNYKGDGKHSDHYVKWLESRILELNIADFVVPKGTFYCGKHHYHCKGRCDKQCKDCVGNTPQ
jgi:hypothetical protein